MSTKQELLESWGVSFDETANPDDIIQYGILGMKWGRRRTDAQLAAARGETVPESGSSDTAESEKSVASKIDPKAQRRADKYNKRNLSDRDIREKIDRLKLERELTKLSNEDLNPIRTRIIENLTDSGFTVGKNVTTAALTVLARKLLDSESVDVAEIAKYLKPKK